MKKHETVTLHIDGDDVDIDAKIAPLIKNLSELGFRTLNSCEDNVPEGWVWIEFVNSYHAEKFLDIVAEYSEDRNSLYNRIRQEWDSDDDSLFWKYSVLPMDHGVDVVLENDEITETFTGKSDFVFKFSIRFPQSDLEQVMNRLSKVKNYEHS